MSDYSYKYIECPKCGSDNIDQEPFYSSPSIIDFKCKCNDCDHAFIKEGYFEYI